MAAPENPDSRQALELARTAQARFETTEAAVGKLGLDLERIKCCSEELLAGIHQGSGQNSVMWILEIAGAMLTAVMAVNREPVPISDQVDPASYAMSVLRDLSTAAGDKGLDFPFLEQLAVDGLKTAEAGGFSNQEVFWAINQATASCELAWARAMAGPVPFARK
ncbi:MAG: hypothetical protein KOO60_13265 [Gemmatimonadales bacterium]|nr:hypothetical protein [Gemmatimonadales bacterium]